MLREGFQLRARVAALFVLCVLSLPVWAADDAACDANLAKVAGARGATLKVCTVTERLVPNRQVIFAVLEFDEETGNQALVLDAPAAAAGRREIVFKEDGLGIGLEPFLFRGKKTLYAIADFDRSGRIGWAIVYAFDTGTALAIRCWDPAVGGFRPVEAWAQNEAGEWYRGKNFSLEAELRGMVEVNADEIRLPAAKPVAYRLGGGRFEKAAAAAQAPSAPAKVAAKSQPPAIAAACGKRATCRVAASKPAGKSESGSALTVLELTFGVKDKPEDAPDKGCEDGNGGYNGGTEYWLIAPPAKPVLVLALCNDGYGAAGVGEDEVAIGNNRLTYTKSGGSNDRWQGTQVVQLSPRRTLLSDSCNYRNTTFGSGVAYHADIGAMKVLSVAQDDRSPAMQNVEPGCPTVKGFWNAQPGAGLMAGVNVPRATEGDNPNYASGTPLGGCAVRLGTPDAPGFLVYGAPLPQRRAELRLTAVARNVLVIQLYDPHPGAPGANWVQGDHLEIWTGKDRSGMHNHPEPLQTAQIGIDLNGKVYAGLGKPALPAVKHAEARDDAGRPVHLFEIRWADEDALNAGVSVVYSQAEGGRQSYVFATAGIVRNRPVYLPVLGEVPVSCGVVNGRWDVTGNSGKLE